MKRATIRARLSYWSTLRAVIKRWNWFKRLSKTPLYSRIRARIPFNTAYRYTDDSEIVSASAPPVLIDWPPGVSKPRVGLVRDYGNRPWWTKYARFLKANDIDYKLYNIHASTWLEEAKGYQLVLGVPSNSPHHLEEIRRKYFLLERHLGIRCYPSFREAFLYEDKILQMYACQVYSFPFARTFVTHDPEEALGAIREIRFPVVSKVASGAGSVGVELVRSARKCRRIIKSAFSNCGRKTHVLYSREKNRVYLQTFVPNDGYDLRVIVIGNSVLGYFRKALKGDFRASGMNLHEWRALPEEAMRLARLLNRHLRFPMLVVDMLAALDGGYKIIEMSPRCAVEPGDEVQIDGEAGRYVFENDERYTFERGNVWMQELALKEVLTQYFLSQNA